MSCLQKHTEFVRRKKNFTLNWCSLVAWVSCLEINNEIVQKTNQFMFKWISLVPLFADLWLSCLQINLKESSSFSLVYWYLHDNIQRTNFDCQNTTLLTIFDFCFRLACAQKFFFSFGKSTSTRARFRRACDFICDSDFWFSQGHKRYYDFEFYSVANEN